MIRPSILDEASKTHRNWKADEKVVAIRGCQSVALPKQSLKNLAASEVRVN